MYRFLAALFVVAFCAGEVNAQVSELDALVGEEKILEFHRYSLKFKGRDETPRLTVFNSGRVVIYFPHYMRRAGVHETYLDEKSLNEFIDKLNGFGLATIDVEQVAEEQELAAMAEESLNQLYYTSDATITTIELNTSETAAANYIVWTNLQSDATRFPALSSLTDLAAAEQFLLDFVAKQPVDQVAPARSAQEVAQ